MPSPSRRWWVLGVVLLGLLSLKLAFDPYPTGSHSHDGSFYYQIARHVSEGDGFQTSVALYHHCAAHRTPTERRKLENWTPKCHQRMRERCAKSMPGCSVPT